MASTVYFCTNRVATGPLDNPKSYSARMQTQLDPTQLIYGTAFVDGTSLIDNNTWTITSLEDVSVGGFSQSAIDDLSKPGRNLLVFLHGFDNNFSDAITRAAFNRAWIAASGRPTADTTVLAFSWPSLGQVIDSPILTAAYLTDQHSARLSGFHGMTFLSRLLPILTTARRNGCKTYLLAHSMGNLLLESAVETWFANGNGDATLFDAAILAAGDCQANTFSQPAPAQLRGLTDLAARMAIFYSGVDQVLHLSQFVNLGAQRLGQDGPLGRQDAAQFPVAQFTMKDASQLRDYPVTLMNSHQYYRMSPTARGWVTAAM
jgi:esterase/lipase superfamily enzyme